MNKLLSLLLLFTTLNFLNAQDYYAEQWKKISANSNAGKVKSNLPLLKEIQTRAMKDKNQAQLLRSLQEEFTILNSVEDDSQNDGVSRFFQNLQTLEKNFQGKEGLIFRVAAGKFIEDYFSHESWQILGRTNISQQDTSAIESWTVLDFKHYLQKHYAELNKEAAALKTIPLRSLQLLFGEKADVTFYPSLFEWMAMREIEFLQNQQIFTPGERKKNQLKVQQLYAEILTNTSGNAHVYFQHQKAKSECENTNCTDLQQRLEKIVADEHSKADYKAKIISEIMDILSAKKEYSAALEWADRAEKLFPQSLFLASIKNRRNSIINPQLSVYFESATLPQKPIHIVAEGKNANAFSLNIYEVKNDFDAFLHYATDSYTLSKMKAVKKTLVRKDTYELPPTRNYTSQKTSLEMKPLPAGLYILEYAVNGAVQNSFYFIVSNSRVLVQEKTAKGASTPVLQLLDRDTGQPLANEKLVIREAVRQGGITVTNLSTDDRALFKMAKNERAPYYRYFLIQQPKSNDFNYFEVVGNAYRDINTEPVTLTKTQIFLDRMIYRPGQTVYFKVINTRREKKSDAVAAGISQTASLYDANSQKISEQKFTTNEFGSYSGTFTLPMDKLNGSFYLKVEDTDGIIYFNVEEYKRPKFEVTFAPLKDEYKYGDTLEIRGSAKTFSGVALSEADVNYEIKKQDIRWRYFWWFPRPETLQNSILGTVKTDSKGDFIIKVTLEKDASKKGVQVDSYNINASVTDINGETQSAAQEVTVASVSHYIQMENIPDALNDENITVKIQPKNYSGQPLGKSYSVKLARLQPEQRIYRSNFANEIQTVPQMSAAEFHQKFPHDYFSETEKEPQVEFMILNGARREGEKLDLGKLPPGKYELQVYNVEGKDTISAKQQFEVFDRKTLGDRKVFLKVVQPKTDYRRGESAEVFVYSAVPDAQVTVFTQRGDGTTSTEQRTFRNGALRYELAVPKDFTAGQINLQFRLTAFNDVQTETAVINILPDKTPLKIETLTFRDKLQPGQAERWSIKISGEANEKITAEVLTAMYDKSLDQFSENNWRWQNLVQRFFSPQDYSVREALSRLYYSKKIAYLKEKYIVQPDFNWFQSNRILYRNSAVAAEAAVSNAYAAPPQISKQLETTHALAGDAAAKESTEILDKIPVRQNLQETAFFFPQLRTDAEGTVTFDFTSPEALTQWKLLFLAHTKDARGATLEKTIVTQKEFSVVPNYPRFLREGDELQFQTKLSSLADKPLSGTARLQILDAFTEVDISGKFSLGGNSAQNFTLTPTGSSSLSWTVKAPKDASAVIFKVVAKAGEFSDGEQQSLAVLPNRMLVTEAVPIFVKEGQTKTFTLENLANSTSATATNFRNTLELTTNPIWEVLFALPSLKNDSNSSADVIFNKWFADVLAAEIFKANPKLKTVFEEYQSKGLLKSNLEKNQELKQLLLEETPWVLQGNSEAEQMEKIARLFEVNSMRSSLQTDFNTLTELQNPDGGFSWQPGYPSSYSTSLYILKQLGRLQQWVGSNITDYQTDVYTNMISRLVSFVDNEVFKYWDVKAENIWNNYALDYLDTRHYWEKTYPLKGKGSELKRLVLQKAPQAKLPEFTFFGLHRAALLFDYYQLPAVSAKLLTYLKETAVESETQGVYWKQNLNGWGWYASKTVNHAGALEAFNKLRPADIQFIEEMKIWLVTQKEVNSWGTSRGTAEVIFTLLNSGKSWTGAESERVTVTWGGMQITAADTKATGYQKMTVQNEKIDRKLGTVSITKPGPGIVQGGLFWQYYEDLDKVQSSENYVSVSKELYRKIKTANGEELQKITAETPLRVGDKVTVRMILNTDRNMEYVHLKDMRAAGFEPIEVLSGYEWKNGLGYYRSTKDASTNFYIQYMPKGKYVFENDYVCNAAGTFSNGFTTLQNYYAPQMNAHTKGEKIEIQ